jgi:hypothetical protein
VKLFTHLLTVYVLLLSMFPCPEELFCADDDSTAVALTSTPADDDCEDDCPPFCNCDCCAVPMMRNCSCLHITSPEQFVVHHALIKTLSLSDIYRPIWQPPQLS